MVGIILAVILNVTLFAGMIKGIDGALNIAEFIMWAMAILNLLVMFITDDELLKAAENHFLYKWSVRSLIFCTIFHSIYWGYVWAPSIWFISALVLMIRKYELDNRKRY